MAATTLRSTEHGARSRISVAIATYNGINYIPEQLDTLRTQTLSPDEVIICDDHSADGTYEFCLEYIERYGLKGWQVFGSDKNVNVYLNFRRALSKCTGNYVFTCDQDDIWMPDKIASMTSVMQSRPEINLLVSNYIPLVNGKPASVRLKYIKRNDGEVIPLRFKDYGINTLRPGCTFCLRRELLDKFKAADIDDMLHDTMLWCYAAMTDSLYLLNRHLIFWRRHWKSASASSFSTYPTVDERIAGTLRSENLYKKFLDAAGGLEITSGNVRELQRMINFQQRRRRMLSKRSVILSALFVMMNLKRYPTLRNALSDVYAMLFLR